MVHTPGPWFYIKDGCWWNIVDVGGEDIVGENGILGGEIGDANANLIAAAPDMLETLKYVRRFISAYDCDAEFVESVIAKAEGYP
jgi:hypothetical protein